MPLSLLRIHRILVAGLAAAALPWPVRGQMPPPRISAEATVLGTHATPALDGAALTEGYLTQPIVHAAWSSAGGALALTGMLNLEGWTLDRGELNAGVWGEGYVDRRHPHTFLHELVATGTTSFAGFDASLAAGRGFPPFGTDDPMVRPFVKFPANHHLAQILERWFVTAAVRRGPLILEAGTFNGDEPTGAESIGELDRVGDSWALRATARPLEGLEVQASRAFVDSPEHVGGAGLDHRKWSLSARLERALGPWATYGLVEWARTDEYASGEAVYAFGSWLVETAAGRDGWRFAARVERTSRAEEERIGNAFRTKRPHGDENIVGATRWTGVSTRVERMLTARTFGLTPFFEAGVVGVEEIAGSSFSPAQLYGDDRLWSLSVGARIGVGARHARMGRYGVAAAPAHAPHH
jgi:hypothetical protein